MRNFLAIFIWFIIPSLCLNQQKVFAQDEVVSYQTFYDELAPYGQWINDGQYGNVWVPNVEPGFRPYSTDGHWVMTDNGNMWVSDVPWAWAAYHYGRWTYNSYYGWVWLPDTEWAPAWVSWRSGGGYYGWAPMGPGHVFGGTYEYPDNYWVFVNPTYLYHPNVYTYYERGDVVVYVHQTSYLRYDGRDHYYYGPRREVIERETHHPVEVYHVSNAREAGSAHMGGREVSIYRPAINRETMHTARPASVREERDHPVGRPEAISANHENRQPAFRTEHTQQQRPQEQQRPQQQQNMQQPNQPNNQTMHAQPQQNSQPMHTQQQNNQPMHTQQQPNNQPMHTQQQQPNNQPMHTQQQQQQQRPQQQQQQQRPQQQQQQQQRPQQQQQQQQRPQQQHEVKKK